MLRVNQLKAAELRKLKAFSESVQVSPTCGRMSEYDSTQVLTVKHRDLLYRVGHWADWQGEFFVVEMRTGIIFRGTLKHIQDMIVLCSAAYYEPHGVR